MFADRNEAGKLLSEKLKDFKGENPLILAIPRGGIVVGDPIALNLNCNLDVVVSKKINPPNHPEYAIGAIMPDGTMHWNQDMSQFLEHPYFVNEVNKKKNEAQRQLEEFRGNSTYDLKNKTIILVDDGIATGATVFVILKWLAKNNPAKTIIASPVIPVNTYEQLKKMSDVVALLIPATFSAVSEFYQKFDQVSEKEVMLILKKHK
ncbi:MAG: phosphoribosyltransferase [Thaumarchaeota archaeon]|nr:phosphoribosyltransferase [Nitrososphaerota archaeon]MBI3641617.1 phosphoribosyltransferase [Nitrososphaerota archaeon]